MIEIPAIAVLAVAAWGLALLGLAAAGAAWLIADWRRAARGAEAIRAWNQKRRWRRVGR